MHFDELPKEEGKGPYVFSFEPDELEVVAAAFREHVYRTVVANPGSVENFDMRVSEWDQGASPRSMRVYDHKIVIDMLKEFYEETREAMSEIPAISGVPPNLNDDIPTRYDLGQKALKLAKHTEEVIGAYYAPTESELSLGVEDMDEELRRLLDPGST